MSKLNKISLLTLLFIGSTLCVSFNAYAQLYVEYFLPAATETPAGSKYYVLNSPIPTNQAIAWLQWNFSKGIDAKFVQDVSNITYKEKGTSTEHKFDNSTGITTTTPTGLIIANADFTYIKDGSAIRTLELKPTTVAFEAGKTYVVTVDNETTLDNGTIRRFQANNNNILQRTYWFEFNTIACTDADGDGYNIEGGDCGAIDCNDNDPAVHPGATEVCNGIDDDCNGTLDDNVTNPLPQHIFYEDKDGDGYGNLKGVTTQACAAPAGYTDNNSDINPEGVFDCKDNNSAVNPGAKEICNGKDDDCNGLTDDGLTGTVLYVGAAWPGSPYTTIQEAVDAACAGDEIWVEQGTYKLSSTINISKAISLYGGFTGSETSRDDRSTDATLTIVDGDNSTRCFLTKSTVTIEGFTITKGKTNASNSGAGLSNGESGSSTPGYLTISNCIFINNNSGNHAGALYNDTGSATVTNCTFTQNSAAKKGGAITNYTTPALSPASNMTITGCVFSKNNAKNAGAICINANSGTNSITDTTFSKNKATPTGTGDGGAIMADESVTITRCIFDQNQAGRSGTFAGSGETGKSAIFTNCIFSGNSALNGAGICINGTSGALGIVTATNCTFTGNTLKSGGKGGAIYTSKPSVDANSVFTVTNSILWGNAGNAIDRLGTTEPLPTVSYTDIDQTGYAGSSGNITGNPLFAGASDYHLQQSSPCIDNGTNVGAPSEDIEKTSRPQGAGYDMGAYEALCTAVYYRDADSDGYGNAAITTLACSVPAGYTDNKTGLFDCNDNNSAVNPAATEVCNGIDDDCDDVIDNGFKFNRYILDFDKDGYGDNDTSVEACAAPDGYISDNGSVYDCNDNNSAVHPGAADAICNGIDNNCNGQTDEGYESQTTNCGTGACAATGSTSCVSGQVVDSCTKGQAGIETCNGIDDDCDGSTDEGYVSQTTSCGVGACARTGTSSCVNGEVQQNCTAGSKTDEVCNGIDDDCDGVIDNGLVVHLYYRDADNDTYGNADNETLACAAPDGYVDNLTAGNKTIAFDCNDRDAFVHPGAAEVCNGKDDDCDGVTDYEGCDNDTTICILKVVPKQISKLLAFLNPFIPFVISAESASGVVFARPFEIDWGTEAINDILRIKIGNRIIVGFLFARPLQLEAGTFDVVVTYGDNGTEQCGTIEVK